MISKLKLKDVGVVSTGNTPSKKVEEYYNSNDINFFTPTDFEEGRINNFKESVNYISNNAKEKARILPEGSVLVTCIGIIGKVGIVEKESAFNQQINAIIPNSEIIDNRFLAYSLISKAEYLRKKANAPVVPIINKTDFQELEIAVPKIEIQIEIVNKLDKIQKLIDICNTQIELFDKLIQAYFIKLFGNPFNKNTEDYILLEDLIINANNGMARRGNDEDGNIVLRLVELQRNFIDYTKVNRIILTDNEKKRYLLNNEDVLFARVNGNPENVGRCACFETINEEVFFNDHIIRVKVDVNKVNPIYLSTLLNSEYGKMEFKDKIKTSAGQYTISQDGIGKVKITLSSIELQNKFALVVKRINERKLKYEEKIKELNQVKECLFNKYF